MRANVMRDAGDGDARVGEDIVNREVEVVRGETQSERQTALWVEVAEQRIVTHFGKRRAEIDGGGRLADAAFLIRHREYMRHKNVGTIIA
ncbi:MAG: hypothetical protein HDKAJFGB_02477 [Anaerolineae bacterium]|nr:hypothetical protein [Anaerolineae bacterium]